MTSRSILASSVLALSLSVTLACGVAAIAQTPTAPTASEKAGAATTRAVDDVKTSANDVKTWTNKQWQAAKREWAKDKQKWSSCESQSHKQKLSGRNSWSFLYSCMTG
jgi:hypothetical protein